MPIQFSYRHPSILDSSETETYAIFGFGHDNISADYKVTELWELCHLILKRIIIIAMML